MAQERSVRLLLIAISCLGAAACTSLVISRPESLMYEAPVAVTVTANADIESGSLRVMLDGTDVSRAFSTSSRSASASLPVLSGPHTLEASANVWNWTTRAYQPTTATARRFDVAAIDLHIASSVVAIAPGSTLQLPVAVYREGGFTGQVDVSNTLGRTVIYPNSYTEMLPLIAPPTPGAREANSVVVATGSISGGLVSDREPLKIRYALRPGLLSPASVVVRRDLENATGPDGVTTLIAQNGPPGGRRFEARFRNASMTTAIVRPIDFDPGTPAFGGGGFCAGGVGGFVISGGSATSPHEISVVLFDILDLQVFSIPATAPGSANVVQPALHFASNCEVVVMVGADTDPTTPQPFRAEVFDLIRRQRICSVASNQRQLQAQLLAPAAGNQILRITAGGQQTDCQLF